MPYTYVHHRVTTDPLQWQAVADTLSHAGAQRLQAAGGLYMAFGAVRSGGHVTNSR